MSVNKCNFSLCGSCHLSACYERRHAKTCNIEKLIVKVTRGSWNLTGDLRRPATSPAPACDYRSRRAIGRMPDALVNQKRSFTNLYARDRLRCPYVVAAGIFCWARSDSIPHTCAASDPTSSDSLTSQFHLSNTYYKGRTTRWCLSRFHSCQLTKSVLFGGLEILGRAFLFFFFFKGTINMYESVQSTLVRHQRRDKRKQIETNVIFAGGTYTSRHNVYKNISKREANEKETGNV